MMISKEEESLLLVSLKRAFICSDFWRERFHEAGISEGDFVPGFPYADLPLIDKEQILKDQTENPPFGRLLSVGPEKVRRIHKTSGTSTTPFFVALTDRDIDDTYTAAVRAFRNAGVGPGDKVVHCLNFNMWSGGVSDYLPIEKVGATGIPFGVGNTSLLLEVIRKIGINAISSTPSYMFAIKERCEQELGIDPKQLGLKRGYFGGEGLLQVPGVRQEIEQTFGMKAIDANYGMSEVTSIIAGEGQDASSLDFHCYGILYAELIDPQGMPVGIEKGARGELVFSSLRREGQPLFRYRTNDLIDVDQVELGEDGLRRIRFRVAGRTDEMLVIRGVNFFPQSLLSVITQVGSSIGSNYRVVRPKPNDHVVTVAMETPETGVADREALAAQFRDKVSAMLQVKVDIQWFKPGSIQTTGNKSQFLVNDVAGLSGNWQA